MVLQPNDFASTSVTSEGYQSSSDFVAVYDREFGASATAGGATFLDVLSEVDLVGDPDLARLEFGLIDAGLRMPAARKKLVQQLAAGLGKRVRKRDIHVGRARELGVGDGSVLLPINLRVQGVRFSFDLIVLQRDRVLGFLLLLGLPGKAIKLADATSLAGAMVNHIGFGLSPQNTIPPTITGTAAQGQTLQAATGTWSNTPTSFTYQWQRCNATGASCLPITGATSSTYTVAAADSSATIRVAVTARNSVGASTPATSSPTAVIP
jgi:hypothetical protein